jgi:hypothetical protein
VAPRDNPANSAERARAEEMTGTATFPMLQSNIRRNKLNKAKLNKKSAWIIDEWVAGSILDRQIITANIGEF